MNLIIVSNFLKKISLIILLGTRYAVLFYSMVPALGGEFNMGICSTWLCSILPKFSNTCGEPYPHSYVRICSFLLDMTLPEFYVYMLELIPNWIYLTLLTPTLTHLTQKFYIIVYILLTFTPCPPNPIFVKQLLL